MQKGIVSKGPGMGIDTGSISSQLLFCTVRIKGQKKSGETSIGTAFFFTFKDSAGEIPVLVTNNHVIEGCDQVTFRLHQAAQDGKHTSRSFDVVMDNFEGLWLKYPDGVDLCVMLIAPLLCAAQQQGKTVFRKIFTEDQIPTPDLLASLVALEDVIMVGYPIGLWDEASNLPLLRKGITATHPAVDFNGRPEGLVDIAAFPGSSGSPVMILNEGSYSTPKGITIGSRFLFLGVLYAAPQYKVDGAIEIEQIPTVLVPMVKSHIPIHIGAYIVVPEKAVYAAASRIFRPSGSSGISFPSQAIEFRHTRSSAKTNRPAPLRSNPSSFRRLDPAAANVALIASPLSLARKHRPIR